LAFAFVFWLLRLCFGFCVCVLDLCLCFALMGHRRYKSTETWFMTLNDLEAMQWI